MNKKQNRSWIAGAIAAACTLALACVVALPVEAQSDATSTRGGQQVEINLPPSETPSQTAGSSEETQQNSAEVDQDDSYGGMEYEPGVVLVTLPAGVSPSDALAAIAEETGIEGVGFADESDASAQAATAAETPLLVELSVPVGMPMSQAVDLISASSVVDAAQPNFVYRLNDADEATAANAETQAHSALVAQNYIVQDMVMQAVSVNDAADQWMLPSIYAYNDATGVGNAWDVVRSDQNSSSNRVTVAVIDEGFQANHPDLIGNVVETYNATDKSTDVSEVSGQGGHGTHVAGIVAATANNNQGVAGVSHNARLLLIKGMNSNGAFDSRDLAHAMDYARSKKSAYNIRVINMSIGGGVASTSTWPDDVLIKAIDNAVGANIAVVCSAGNDFTDGKNNHWVPPYIDYPADYRNVISVMNLTHTGNDPHNVSLASNSNYNDSSTTESSMNTGKNISAPGTSIKGAYPNSTYLDKSGTSMAAPCVSGVLALAFTKQPNLTVAEATSLLYSTTTDIGDEGWDRKTGYGEVNAYRAVTEADAFISGATSVQVGKTITLAASDSNVWLWKSSEPAVATVSNGVVAGVSGGTARISATFTFAGLRWARYQDITVYDPVIKGNASATVGKTVTKSVASTPVGSWKWASSKTDVATVNSNGVVTALKPGTTTLRATLSSNDNVYAEQTFTVTKADLSAVTATFGTYAYNGSAQKATPTVKVGSVTLTAPTDYTLEYTSNGDYTNAGTKSVTIKLTGTRTASGSVAKSYTIGRRSASITANSKAKTYDGTALTATSAGYTTSGFVNSDLRAVSLSGAITNAGSTTSTVAGYTLANGASSNYSVTTKNGTLTVNAFPLSSCAISLSSTAFTYTGSAVTPTVTVKRGTTTLRNGTDYTVVYSNNKNAGTGTVLISGKGNYTGSVTRAFVISKGVIETYAGADRYATAQKIASAAAAATSSIKGVIVCSCNEGRFPDALSAAGLSGVLGYPVVTVNGNGLTQSDRTALMAMKNKCSGSLDILIVGGSSSVSTSVEYALRSYGSVSKRFNGADRYETNRMICEYGKNHGSGWSSSYAFLARGDNFPDALTIAPFLVWKKCPIVLVNPSSTSLTYAQRTAVSSASQVIALGSSVSVTDAALSAARSACAGHVASRLYGADRYTTSAAIVKWELGQGMKVEGAGVATGQKFPDSLASSWLLGNNGSVLGLVAPSGANSAMMVALKTGAASGAPSALRVFGDTSSVPSAVRSQVASAVGWPSFNTVPK